MDSTQGGASARVLAVESHGRGSHTTHNLELG